jgi:site-specific recombinase
METVYLAGKYLKLKNFIHEIRRAYAQNPDEFNPSFEKLWHQCDTEVKQELLLFSAELVNHAFFVNAFAEYGINSNNGFFSEIITRVKHKILPIILPDEELSYFIQYLFDAPNDYLWLEKIDLKNWYLILNYVQKSDFKLNNKIVEQICNALSILGNRLTTLGIDPSLSAKFPKIDDLGSPFFKLNNELDLAIKLIDELNLKSINNAQVAQIKLNIEEIENLFIHIQTQIKETGTSLNLIFLLKRGQQHVKRVKLLCEILFCKNEQEQLFLNSTLIVELVTAEQSKHSIFQFFKSHTQILAYRIVSHTSKKGESYIGYNKEENQALFKSAVGGGLIVVILVFIKHLIHQLHLSLFFEGLLFGLNYGLGFVLMHLLHFTLATKQPALTASFIADSIDNADVSNKKSRTVFYQIIKSQFISLLGNLIVVIPLCFLIGIGFYHLFNNHILNHEAAIDTLANNNLFYSLSFLYAIITGILLSLSGMVIGYIDNKVVYSEIGLRVEKHPLIVKRYQLNKRKKIASFFERNLGAIIGNLFLGFSLGMIGNIGKFIGLPIDIRHITISAGNFSIALSNLNSTNLILIIITLVSIIIIGLVNIAVSFLISFILACRSRGLSWKQSIKLLLTVS